MLEWLCTEKRTGVGNRERKLDNKRGLAHSNKGNMPRTEQYNASTLCT